MLGKTYAIYCPERFTVQKVDQFLYEINIYLKCYNQNIKIGYLMTCHKRCVCLRQTKFNFQIHIHSNAHNLIMYSTSYIIFKKLVKSWDSWTGSDIFQPTLTDAHHFA